MRRLVKLFKITLLSVVIALVCSCATQPKTPPDPYESLNHKTYTFNEILDTMFFHPVAKVYATITPDPLQAGIHNAFKNLFTTTTIANDLFQARFDFAAADISRMLVNSTIGILGLFDVAKHMKLPYHYEDFGMTMAYWGAKSPNYLETPVLGPRTFRDAFAIPFDIATNPITYITPFYLAVILATAAIIDTRAQLLAADATIAQSFDPYVFIRDAYMQNRAQMVANNNSMRNYREFQAQQLQGFAPAEPLNDLGIGIKGKQDSADQTANGSDTSAGTTQ